MMRIYNHIQKITNVSIHPRIVLQMKSDNLDNITEELIEKALLELETNINSLPVTKVDDNTQIVFTCHLERK